MFKNYKKYNFLTLKSKRLKRLSGLPFAGFLVVICKGFFAEGRVVRSIRLFRLRILGIATLKLSWGLLASKTEEKNTNIVSTPQTLLVPTATFPKVCNKENRNLLCLCCALLWLCRKEHLQRFCDESWALENYQIGEAYFSLQFIK